MGGLRRIIGERCALSGNQPTGLAGEERAQASFGQKSGTDALRLIATPGAGADSPPQPRQPTLRVGREVADRRGWQQHLHVQAAGWRGW